MTWSMYCRCMALVPQVPQIMPSAWPLSTIMALISDRRRRISILAIGMVMPLRAVIW